MKYHFDNFVLDADAYRLLRDGKNRHVEPQVLDILRYLAAHRDRVVTRDELLDAVWSDRTVSDSSLTTSIKSARKAVDDDGKRQAVIRTIHGRGFQFVAEVIEGPDASGTPGQMARNSAPSAGAGKTAAAPATGGRVRWMAAVFVLLLLAAVVGFAAKKSSRRPEDTAPRLAVLAFRDASETQDQAYIGDGIADGIGGVLIQVEGLEVVGRTSAFSFRGGEADNEAIGEGLGVTHYIEGSVLKDGDRIRVEARLVRTGDGLHVWSKTFDRAAFNIVGIQDDIAVSVAETLQGESRADRLETHLSAVQGTDPETYRLYLQARWMLDNPNAERVALARDHFREVVARDPDFARGYSGLAAAEAEYPRYHHYRDPAAEVAGREKAEILAAQALEIDPGLSEPYAVLGNAYGRDWQWSHSRRMLESALDASPENARTRMQYGLLLWITGHSEEALRQLDAAFVREPLHADIIGFRAALLRIVGRQQEALEAARLSVALGRDFSRLGLALLSLDRGDTEQAKAHFMDYFQRRGLPDEELNARREWHAMLYSSQPDKTKLIELIKSSRKRALIPDSTAAGWYRDAGEYEVAMKLFLERHPGPRGFLADVWSPEYQALRRHPYFQTFVEQVGLMDHWREVGFPDLCRPKGSHGIACD